MVEVEEEFGPKTFIKQSQKNVSRRFFLLLKNKNYFFQLLERQSHRPLKS